ncbi:MAG TPA: gamma-glutamyltransferase [Bryobacteraceae bacterium]|nr:gamma-glutamyltransferase [Bryobacteraceae bacterium]
MLLRVLVALIALPCFAQDPPEVKHPFWRTLVMGTHGMVAAEHPLQARAGLLALERGGNAFDAAVALFYMTSVVEQHQAGLGGDAFILAYAANQKRVIFINGTGPAPKLATLERMRKEGGIPPTGMLANTVPGAVGGFDLALRKYGTRKYPELMAEAIAAARDGHPLTHWAAGNHNASLSKLNPYPSSVKALLKNGGAFEPGDVFVQPDLARSLEIIAKEGADSFYRGKLARLTADFYKKHGGLLRYEDLASYQPEEGPPIRVAYRGYDVYQSAPNSQGIVLLQALNMLEPIDLKAMGHNSPEYVHTLVETLKLAFADRDHWIADPRFTKVPTEQLLSKRYAEERRKLVDPRRAQAGAAPYGSPGETSSFSIADRFGNLVSVTHSVNSTFGSGVVVEGGGYVLNNRLQYFSLDEKHANVLVPGKRPRHTINPALALKDGKPVMAWNTPGGDNQPQALLQAFLNVVEFGMNPQLALEQATVTTANFHGSNYPQAVGDRLTLPEVLAAKIGDALRAKGHKLEVTKMQRPYSQQPSGAGAVKMIWIDPRSGVMFGAVSPAKDDYAMGW